MKTRSPLTLHFTRSRRTFTPKRLLRTMCVYSRGIWCRLLQGLLRPLTCWQMPDTRYSVITHLPTTERDSLALIFADTASIAYLPRAYQSLAKQYRQLIRWRYTTTSNRQTKEAANTKRKFQRPATQQKNTIHKPAVPTAKASEIQLKTSGTRRQTQSRSTDSCARFGCVPIISAQKTQQPMTTDRRVSGCSRSTGSSALPFSEKKSACFGCIGAIGGCKQFGFLGGGGGGEQVWAQEDEGEGNVKTGLTTKGALIDGVNWLGLWWRKMELKLLGWCLDLIELDHLNGFGRWGLDNARRWCI